MIAERQEELAALGAVDLLSPAEQAELAAAAGMEGQSGLEHVGGDIYRNP